MAKTVIPMTLRCTSCSYYRDFGRRGEKIIKCHCGGEMEKLVHLKNGTYKNKGGELFKLEPPYTKNKKGMKTLEQLQEEWGNSICGREPEKYIYDYMSDQLKEERNKAIDAAKELFNDEPMQFWRWQILQRLESLKSDSK